MLGRPSGRKSSNAFGDRFLARKPRSVDLTQVTEWDDGKIRRKEDYLAAEEPLEIRIGDDPLSVTMRTPGHDLELAAGFLFTEGLVQRRAQIITLEEDAGAADENRGNVVLAKLAPEAAPDFEKMRRHFFRRVELRHLRKGFDRLRASANARAAQSGLSSGSGGVWFGFRKCCERRRPSSGGPAGCMLRRSSTALGNCSSCVRISADTTRWTK